MKLTLGQAAKEVEVSKTAISNSIKSGRLSAQRTDDGSYAIDPAELFRVYPPKPVNGTVNLTKLDPQINPVNAAEIGVLTAQLTGQQQLLEEKDKQISRMIREKENLEERLDEQIQQSKRITLLLEHKNASVAQGAGEWEKAFEVLEERISNQIATQEQRAQREIEIMKRRAQKKIAQYKAALEAEKKKTFLQKLFGK